MTVFVVARATEKKKKEVSYKIIELGKGRTRGKEHNSSQSAKSSESSNNLSILDRVRLNNAGRLIIGHLNTDSLRNKFEMPPRNCSG